MKVYTDFATKPDFLHHNRLDDVTIHFKPFLDSPFKFTQSNKDTLKQLFEKIKEKGIISIFSNLHVSTWKQHLYFCPDFRRSKK